MCKVKKLKKQMKAEALRLNSRIDALTRRMEYELREQAKKAHPSAMTPEARNWCDMVDKQYAEAADAALARANELKPKGKRLTFKRVKSDLHGQQFLATQQQLDKLDRLGVGFSHGAVRRINGKNFVETRMVPFITEYNVSELTRQVNALFSPSYSFYVEVQELARA